MSSCINNQSASNNEVSDDENDFDEFEPLQMSNELCQFFNVRFGSRESFFQVRQKVQKYIRKKNLMVPQDMRKFYLDQNLKNMLQLPAVDSDMTYFRLQSCLFKQLKR